MDIQFTITNKIKGDDSNNDVDKFQKIVLSYLQMNNSNNNRSITLINTILIQLQKQKQPLKKLFNTITLILSFQQENNHSKSLQNTKILKDNTASLLQQIFNKYYHILQNTQQSLIFQFLSFSISQLFHGSTSNSYINIIYQLYQKIYHNTNVQPYAQPLYQINHIILTQLFENPKMHPLSYNQQSRYKLYYLLLSSLTYHHKNNNFKLPIKYINLITNSIISQKDPRNMFHVFNLYLFILNSYSIQQLQPFQEQLFQHLQQYYPLDFAGGQQQMKQYNVNIKMLKDKLDQCLTRKLFLINNNKCQMLLLNKFSTPPINQYVNTFKMFVQEINRNQLKCNESWGVLLLKFLDEQFLLQNESELYQDQDEIGLMICKIINEILMINNVKNRMQLLLSFKCNKIMIKIINKIMNMIFEQQSQSNKYGGRILNILKVLIKRLKQPCKCLMIQLIMNRYNRYIKKHNVKQQCQQKYNKINNQNKEQQFRLMLMYKLGLLMIIPYNNININIDMVLYLQKMFKMNNSNNIKVIILKIFMQMYKNNMIKRLIDKVHQNTIIKYIKQQRQKQQQKYNINSYIDYLLVIDNNYLIQNIIKNKSNQNHYSKIYTILNIIISIQQNNKLYKQQQLSNQLIKSINQLNNDLLSQQQSSLTINNIVSNIKYKTFISLITHYLVSTSIILNNHQFITILQKQLIQRLLSSSIQTSIIQLLISISQIWQLYIFRNICKIILIQKSNKYKQQLLKHIHHIINKNQTQQQQPNYLLLLKLYFNSILIKLNLQSSQYHKYYFQITTPSKNQLQKYISYIIPSQQLLKSIKINHNNNNNISQLSYLKSLFQPTSIHYHWNKSHSPYLIPFLPQPILNKDANIILNIVIPTKNIIIINHIINHLPNHKIVSQIIPFIISYLQQLYQNNNTTNQYPILQILAAHQILNKLYHSDTIFNNNNNNKSLIQTQMSHSIILSSLQNNSQDILSILKQALHHRKRLIRQSARLLLFKYQKIHTFKNI